MYPDSKKFGRGPRELTGDRDLISHFKLLPHYEFFGESSLPLSISDTHYLHNVVGDTEIRKGEEMQLDQLTRDTSFSRDTSSCIRPFDLDVLREAFQLRETAPVNLSPSDKGTPTIAGKSKSEMKDKEKKHKKHKDKDKEKDKEHRKHRHRHKDRSNDKDKDKKKDKSGYQDPGAEHSRKHEKKRKHDEEDLSGVHKQKKNKHKSSKIDEIGAIKVPVCWCSSQEYPQDGFSSVYPLVSYIKGSHLVDIDGYVLVWGLPRAHLRVVVAGSLVNKIMKGAVVFVAIHAMHVIWYVQFK